MVTFHPIITFDANSLVIFSNIRYQVVCILIGQADCRLDTKVLLRFFAHSSYRQLWRLRFGTNPIIHALSTSTLELGQLIFVSLQLDG